MLATTENKMERRHEILARLHAAVDHIRTSDDFQEFLTVQAKFHTYSVRNVMLILSQRPTATRVAGFRTWQELGRYVRKGERGIAIICPRPYRHERTVTRDDGTEETEESAGLSFAVGYVFDVAQTDGRELPKPPRPVTLGDGGDELYAHIARLARYLKIHVRESAGDDLGTAHGMFRPGERLIVVRREGSMQMAKTLTHELAHALTHDKVDDRSTAEVIAEGVAYTVCAHYGFDTVGYSAPYVAQWAEDRKSLMRALATIQQTAGLIIDGADALAKRGTAA